MTWNQMADPKIGDPWTQTQANLYVRDNLISLRRGDVGQKGLNFPPTAIAAAGGSHVSALTSLLPTAQMDEAYRLTVNVSYVAYHTTGSGALINCVVKDETGTDISVAAINFTPGVSNATRRWLGMQGQKDYAAPGSPVNPGYTLTFTTVGGTGFVVVLRYWSEAHITGVTL